MERPTDAELRSSPKANQNDSNTKPHGLSPTRWRRYKWKAVMERTGGSGITQFAEGEPKRRNYQIPWITPNPLEAL